jgi:hypothetical protein
MKSCHSELKSIVIRLGGFHLLMSYMGSIGYIMGGSGLADLWETVYAPNTVTHMMTGHAYARALRAHLLTSVAIMSNLLKAPGCLDEIDLTRLQAVHESLLNGQYLTANVEQEECIHQLTQVMDELMEVAATQRTGKLWVEYLKQVSVIRDFIRAERTGNGFTSLYGLQNYPPVACCWSSCIC